MVLVVDIVRNGLPAFWQHSLVLDVPVTAEDIDPAGKRDPAELRSADYFAPVRARRCEAQFPVSRAAPSEEARGS